MNTPKILVTRRIPEQALSRLREAGELTVWPDAEPPPYDRLVHLVEGAAGLLCLLSDRVDEGLLAGAPTLKVVSTMSVGYEHIDMAACRQRGIAVGHTPGVLTEATADFALTLILAVARRLIESIEFAREGHWKTWDPMGFLGLELSQATLGIIGLGRIGEAVARRAKGFGATLLYHDPIRNRALEQELELSARDLPTLLSEADIVSLHAPLTEHTALLMDEAALRRMKPTAILINTARGGLVDTEALLRALEGGWIAGAGLDVTDPEPLPADHPLYGLSNCVITPHVASATVVARGQMADIAAANLLAGLSGKPLPYPVPDA